MEQDQDRQDGRTEVITEPTAASPPEPLAGKDYFCQDNLYKLSPFELAVVGSLPAYIWEEDQGHYN